MRALKNAAALIFLVVFFAGFIWLVGRTYRQRFEQTLEAIEPQLARAEAHIGPLTVNESTCRFLKPNVADHYLMPLLCHRCAKEGERLRENYEVDVLEGHCARRGTNTLELVRRPAR